MTTDVSGRSAVHEGNRTWDVLHGVAKLSEITLLGCVPKNTRRTLGAGVKSPDTQSVTATITIVRAYVSGDADPAFAGAQFLDDDLGLWAASLVVCGS